MNQGMNVPRHVAIIMDGNGRWAKQQNLPRIAGHRAGVEAVRRITKHCAKRGIKFLTLFAFSSENWRRPEQEVNSLMELFITALRREIKKIHQNNVKIKIIGDRSRFSKQLCDSIQDAERLTQHNTGLQLNIAANYGGQWDITQATQRIAQAVADGRLCPEQITEQTVAEHLATMGMINPDLFIRTSGEQRISNFLLWQLAYTELYFCTTLWPDFAEADMDEAIAFYDSRERRYGATSEQVSEVIPSVASS